MYEILKRLIDVLAATVLVALLFPLMLIITLVIRVRMGSPTLFSQMRVGLRERRFHLLKYRTMNDSRDEYGELLSDEQRLTRLGRFLRRTSLDELPQLVNVLRGDVSLVGPRPLLVEYVPLYTPEQARRHTVKPGITGMAQVSGRNALTWEEKFKFDVWYVDHRSIVLDMRIIWRTFKMVLKGVGISAVGDATMPKFTGS